MYVSVCISVYLWHLPSIHSGLRANLRRPLQPLYLQRHPAAQILSTYSLPKIKIVNVSYRESERDERGEIERRKNRKYLINVPIFPTFFYPAPHMRNCISQLRVCVSYEVMSCTNLSSPEVNYQSIRMFTCTQIFNYHYDYDNHINSIFCLTITNLALLQI